MKDKERIEERVGEILQDYRNVKITYTDAVESLSTLIAAGLGFSEEKDREIESLKKRYAEMVTRYESMHELKQELYAIRERASVENIKGIITEPCCKKEICKTVAICSAECPWFVRNENELAKAIHESIVKEVRG